MHVYTHNMKWRVQWTPNASQMLQTATECCCPIPGEHCWVAIYYAGRSQSGWTIFYEITRRRSLEITSSRKRVAIYTFSRKPDLRTYEKL